MMMLLGIDTATPSTVVALQTPEGAMSEARDDPPAGVRPAHAVALLGLARELLDGAGASWPDVDRIAVGLGPGGFTGLRIGISTARALAQAHGIAMVGVSSLHALALGAAKAAAGRPVLAAIDARRGEVFAAAWSGNGVPLIAPAAYEPGALVGLTAAFAGSPLGVGDGALRFASELRATGVEIAPEDSALHAISGAALCRLGSAAVPLERERVLPDYRREPDAKPPRLP